MSRMMRLVLNKKLGEASHSPAVQTPRSRVTTPRRFLGFGWLVFR